MKTKYMLHRYVMRSDVETFFSPLQETKKQNVIERIIT